MKYGFGVDVGGTTVKLGLLSEAGELLEKWELPTRTENGGENILPDIARSVQDCMARRGLSRDDCLGLGIGVPGPVDASGMVNRCVNLNWGVFNLHDALGILTGLRVRAGNDANCAALGEFWMGGGSGCRSAIFVTLGTGIGGGVIVDGRLLTGAHGVGGELGHIEISAPDKAPCTCGKRGCVDAYCSAKVLSALTGGNLALFFDGLRAGDRTLQAAWDEYLAHLAVAVNNLRMIFDCDVIVGGYVGGFLSEFGAPLRELLARHNTFEPDSSYLKFSRYQLESSALGAALVHIESFIQSL